MIEQAFTHLRDELGKKVYVEIKNEVRPTQIDSLQYLKDQYVNILIVANYITPNAKKLLREKELNYIDRVGNMWFRLEPIYIHIDGLSNQPPTEDRKNRAFTRTGIKVVFQILHDPELINATYRHIVNVTGVALGTIPKVVEGLRQEGFLLKKTENKWVIKDYDELLNRWQYEYVKRLKPALFVKCYRPADPEFYRNWKEMGLIGGAQWGGEPAGDILTKYLRPEVYTLYTNQPQQEIMKKYRWVPDPDGNIHVYKQFWEVENDSKPQKCVPTVVAYADLMETGDSRCIETATLIYEQFLQKY